MYISIFIVCGGVHRRGPGEGGDMYEHAHTHTHKRAVKTLALHSPNKVEGSTKLRDVESEPYISDPCASICAAGEHEGSNLVDGGQLSEPLGPVGGGRLAEHSGNQILVRHKEY